jgi:hypothetical protein
MNSKENNRQQLKECFIDLAMRAKETNEPYIQSICLVLAGSITEQSDAALALWLGEFAKMRLDIIKEESDQDQE